MSIKQLRHKRMEYDELNEIKLIQTALSLYIPSAYTSCNVCRNGLGWYNPGRFRRIYVKAAGVFRRPSAHASAVIKTLKQLRLGSWHARAEERTGKGGRRGRKRERGRELGATARNNCAIVSCHLNCRMYDKLRRHPRRAKATMHYVPSAAPHALAKGETTRVQCDNETITRYRFERGDRRWEHRDRVIRAVLRLRLLWFAQRLAR